MNAARSALEETITLQQAKKLIQCMAHEQSFLLLAPPGVGKSEMVYQAAQEAGLPCRSLLGTQIAPEDVSGVPRIVGERSVFCPPRAAAAGEARAVLPVPRRTAGLRARRAEGVLLAAARAPARRARAAAGHLGGRRRQPRPGPRAGALDELGPRQPRDDPASCASTSTSGWPGPARHGVRADIRNFISYMPEALMRPVPHEPVPFSTPRAWALLSRALDLAEAAGILTRETRRALAFGRLSAEDAAVFCALAEESIGAMQPIEYYFEHPEPAAAGRCRALVRARTASARTCATASSAGSKPRDGQPVPAQPPARAPAHPAHRPGRPVGRARRRRRDARPPQAGRRSCDPGARVPTSRETLERIERGLRMVTVPFPHLAGLVAAVRVDARRPRPDDGRVRVRPAGRQPGSSCAA